MTRLGSALTLKGVAAVIALLLVAGLLFWPARALQGPIVGDHSWRQAWTYSVAHNFIDESASFFYPRHDWRGDGPGIVGSEPPFYAYGLSLLMRVFGDGPIVCRVTTWLFFLASLIAGWRLLRSAGIDLEPWLFLIAVALSPMALCDFKQIQPDPVSASLALIGAALLRRSALDASWRGFAAGLATCTMSVLVKPNALAVVPALYLFANLGGRNASLRRWGITAVAFVIPVLLWGSWHLWAEHLTRTYAAGNYLISIELRPKELFDNLRKASGWEHLTLFLLPAYVSSWWLAPSALIGLVLGFSVRYRVLSLCFLVWIVGMTIEAGAFSSRLRNNWYYCLLFLAPLAYFSSIGLAVLLRVLVDPHGAPRRELAGAMVLVLALLIGAWLAPDTPWGNFSADGRELGFWAHADVWFDRRRWFLLGVLALCAVAGWLAPTLVARSIYWARWLVVPALVFCARDAVVDAIQAVRARSGEASWASVRLTIAEARAMANRFSTRDDLFVVVRDNPDGLYRVLRRGFAETQAPNATASSEYYVRRGARFAMHYADFGPPPPWLAKAPVLAQGEYATLYCLDVRGCPPLHPAAQTPGALR